MTPVEEGKTSSGRQWKSWAAAAQADQAQAAAQEEEAAGRARVELHRGVARAGGPADRPGDELGGRLERRHGRSAVDRAAGHRS